MMLNAADYLLILGIAVCAGFIIKRTYDYFKKKK